MRWLKTKWCFAWSDGKDGLGEWPFLLHLLLCSIYSEVMVRVNDSRVEENGDWWRGEWQVHLSLSHFLVFLVSRSFSPFLVSMETNEGMKDGKWSSLLHGFLILLVCADLLAGLFALLAPLALLVFVPSVAVPLLTVVPPPATAANERWREQEREKMIGREGQV